MSARDVIAATMESFSVVPGDAADFTIADLTAAGHRILGPDELDPVTVEREALERAMQAMNDWLHQYAGEFCNEEDVEASGKRIQNHGGTLAYITDVQQQIGNALRPLPPAKDGEA